jgi:23S rRNA pseudouridine1911/1915/1917 synthase
MLHAQQLQFEDPGGAGLVEFTAAPPPDMLKVIATIDWKS